MRLIDADELEKVITQDWFLDILLTQTSKYDMGKKLVNMIDSVPLAYDVDAVVEELRKSEMCPRCLNGHNSTSHCATFCDVGKKLEFVRKGGV